MTVEHSEKKRVPPITARFFNPVPPPVDPANVVWMAQELRTCLGTLEGKACGGDLELSNDDKREYVCSRCGRVWGSEQEQMRIPLEEDNVADGHAEGQYSPETHADWGGGLGSKVDQFLAADVLGDSGEMPEQVRTRLEDELLVTELATGERVMVKNGKFRDPMSLRRASHAQVSLTNPLLKTLLTLNSSFCKKHGFYKSKNENHLRFSDQSGINMIHVCRFYVCGPGKLHFDTWSLAASLFCRLFKQWYPQRYRSLRAEPDAKDKYPELCLPDDVVNYFGLVLDSCHPPVLPVLP